MTRFHAWAGLLVLTMVAGCGKSLDGLTKPVEVKEYTLKGEVREVDENNRSLVIRHEDIPGFMVAMTMPFRLPEGTDFAEFQPGDHVEGKLRVQSKAGNVIDYEVVGMAVVKPAVKTLDVQDLTKGMPKVVTQPTRLQPGDEAPDFKMLDQDGKERRLSDMRGAVVVLTFVYTRCPLPEFCPAMDRKFADLARAVSATASRASKVRLVSLSFDPDNDTPEVLRKHAAIRGAVPPVWTYASASHEDLARIAPPFGLMFGPVKNEIVHNLCTAVIGPDGRIVRLDVGTHDNAWTTADMLKTIAGALPNGSTASKAD